MNKRFIQSALTLVVACAAVASPASAQLSKLKKAATDKAKEAAGVKDAPKPGADAAVSRDYAITSDRVDLMLKALAPAVQKAEREQALKTARSEYEAKSKKTQDCVEAALKAKSAAMTAPDVASMQKSARITQQLSGIAQRMSAAQVANRYREYLADQDSVQVMSVESSSVMLNITTCGSMPYKSAMILDADAEQMAASANNHGGPTRGTVIDAPNRGGMTYQQFGMVRERIAVWALQQTGNAKPNDSKYATYTDSENAALNTRVAELKKLAPLFKGGTLGWSSWNDLAEW